MAVTLRPHAAIPPNPELRDTQAVAELFLGIFGAIYSLIARIAASSSFHLSLVGMT